MAKPDSSRSQDDGDNPPRKLSAIDRVILKALGDNRSVGLQSDPAAEDYPELWKFLTKVDGGKDYVMQPATLSIVLGPEGVLVTLTHRDLKVSYPASCPHLADAFRAVEAVLNLPNPPCRYWGKDSQVQLKRRKQK